MRIRDAATIAALEMEDLMGVVHRPKEKEERAFAIPYPTMSSNLQLGEFAGFVSEHKTGETDDVYVLLDNALKSEDYAYVAIPHVVWRDTETPHRCWQLTSMPLRCASGTAARVTRRTACRRPCGARPSPAATPPSATAR